MQTVISVFCVSVFSISIHCLCLFRTTELYELHSFEERKKLEEARKDSLLVFGGSAATLLTF